MLPASSAYPSNIYNVDTSDDDDMEPMVNTRVGRTIHRSYIGRRVGCSQPVLVALFIISGFVFLFFQMAGMMPKRPGPPSFAWAPNVSRNISAYVRPTVTTALMQPENFCQDDPFLVFVVPSAINNTKQRDTIRRTWGQWAGCGPSPPSSIDEGADSQGTTKKKSVLAKMMVAPPKTSKLVFLLGKSKGDQPISETLQEESFKYGDLIIEDFIDSYTNLTLKTVFMLKWVHRNCPTVKFVMKVDDDIFVNVVNLQKTLLNQTITKTPLLMGSLICGAKPIHDQWSKWYTPQYMFREGKYPNYLSGTGYVYSGDLVERLFKAALAAPYFHLEDVFLTGLCARSIGVRPVDNVGFSYHPRAVSPCLFKEVIMGHGVGPSTMVKLWNMLNEPATVAKCHPIKKSKLRSYNPKCSWR